MPVEQAGTHHPVHAGGNALAFLDDLVPRGDGDAALADGIHALLHDGAVVRILAPLQCDGIFAGNAARLRAGGKYDAQVVAIDDLPAGPVGQLLDDVAVIAGLVVRQDGDVPLRNDEAHRICGMAQVVVGLFDLRLYEPAARLGGYGPGVLPVPFAAVQEGLPSPAGISGQRGIVGLIAVGPAGDAHAGVDGRLADLRHDERGLGVVVVCVALDPVPDPVVAGVGAGGDRLAPYDRIPGRGIADEVLQRAALGLAGLHQRLGLAVVDQRIRDHHAGRDPTDGHEQGLRLGVPVVFVAEHLVPDGVVAGFGAGGRFCAPAARTRGRGLAHGILHGAVYRHAGLHQRLRLAVVDQPADGLGRDHDGIEREDFQRRLGPGGPVILRVDREEDHRVGLLAAVGHSGHDALHVPLKVSLHLGRPRAAGQLALLQRLAVVDGVGVGRRDDRDRGLLDGHADGLGRAVPVIVVALHAVPHHVVAGIGAGGDGRGIRPACPFRRAGGIFHRAVIGLARRDERLGAAVVDQLQGRGRDGGSVRLRDGRLNARRPEILVVIVAGNHVRYIVGSRLDTGGDGFAEPTRLAGVQHRTAGGHARDRHERLIRPVVGAVDCHDRCRRAFGLVDVYGDRSCLGTALVVAVALRRGPHLH